MDSPLARIGVILAALAAVAAGVWLYSKARPGVPCPSLEEVHIVSSSRAAGAATDAWKSVPYGETVMLAAVVKARRPDGSVFHVSPVESPVLGGRALARGESRPSWPAGCGDLVFLWFSVERANPSDAASPYKDRFQGSWGFAPTQPADVRPRLLTREGEKDARPNLGAAFFRVRAEIRHPSTHKLLQTVSTPGADHLNAGGDPSALHRVAIGAP
jgi:hypothetical protein